MQTIYVTTSNFIRHEGNLVDLTEYRRKLDLAQGRVAPEEQEATRTVRPRTVHRRKRVLSALTLDYAASVALIITALSFAVKIL